VKEWRPVASVSFTRPRGPPGPAQEEGAWPEQATTNGRKKGRTEEGGGGLPVADNGRWWVDKRSGEGPFYRRTFRGKMGRWQHLHTGVAGSYAAHTQGAAAGQSGSGRRP
jgi:hypothetical protein